MSSQAQQELWAKILFRLGKRIEQSTKKLRSTIQSRIGQIYIFDRNHLTDTINDLWKGKIKTLADLTKASSTSKYFEEAFDIRKIVPNWEMVLNEFEAEARRLEEKALSSASSVKVGGMTQADRKNYILGAISNIKESKIPLLIAGQSIYVFHNHEAAAKFHRDTIMKKVTALVEKYWIEPLTKDRKFNEKIVVNKGKPNETSLPSPKEQIQARLNTDYLHVGHGADIGASVAALKTLGDLRFYLTSAENRGLEPELLKRLSDLHTKAMTEYAAVGLNTQHANQAELQAYNIHATKDFYINYRGKLKGDFISVISLQSAWGNLLDSREERKIIDDVRETISKDFATIKGSLSFEESYVKTLMYALSNNIKAAKTSVPTLKEYKKRTVSNVGKKSSSTVNSGQISVPKKVSGAISPITPKGKQKSKAANNGALQLLAHINLKLNSTVAANMGTPALENRTGRFASGVRAIDIATTPQGYPSIGYTYQKRPYQIFEVGAGRRPWATTDRDPRSLIDKSIREIAVEVFVGRLYTRRM